MSAQLQLGEVTVDVLKKDIKHIHLSVYPPNGKVRISAPSGMKLDTIRVFAIAKLAWIKQQQRKMQAQEREPVREFLDRESHFVWGRRYLLKVVEVEAAPIVELKHGKMLLQVRPGTTSAQRHAIVSQWYRDQIKSAMPALIEKWGPILGVKPGRVFVQKMKTKWGSCNTTTSSIRLNSDLAKKPAQCLEYIAVHELVHLLERRHNDRFLALMDGCLPQWRQLRVLLNRSPLSHEEWLY